MLSVPQSPLSALEVGQGQARPVSFCGKANSTSENSSPEHPAPAPAISVTRPNRVSASVDDSALDLLRARYNAQHRDRAASLSAEHLRRTGHHSNMESSSPHTSPKLQRSSSFRIKRPPKLFRTPSNGSDGYEPLNTDFTEEANQFSRERVTSVHRVLSRNPSLKSNGTSPRHYRAAALVPAKHRIVQLESSSSEEEEEEIMDNSSRNSMVSPPSESDLDFGSASRTNRANTVIGQWKSLLLNDYNEATKVPEDSSSSKKATAGSRGKSANSVMMKLAKKFSKKNLPITQDDGDESSVAGESLGRGGSSRMKQRSSSVSNLNSLEGMGRRSQSMEHLGPMSVNTRSGSGSPHMARSLSKGKLDSRRSLEMDSDSSVSSGLYRAGSKGLTGDPADALFEAIEQGNLDAVASLIEANLVTKFNTLNEDEFLAVDLSVMLGHHEIAQLLLKIGAKDSPKFCRDPVSRQSRLSALINEAERDLYRLKEHFTSMSATSGAVKDMEKRYKRGERRLQLYRHMLSNYDAAGVPDAPTNVQLHVTSSRSLMVTFSEPEKINRATITRYKIEWCTSEDFKPVVGDFVLTDLRTLEYIIPDLNPGEGYFVRVCAYNMKGFGPVTSSSPPSALPSSWHDLSGSAPRYQGCTDKIHLVAAQFGLTWAPVSAGSAAQAASAAVKAKSSKKTNPLTRMFTSAVKFHKVLKPGVYITSLVYSDDTKMLVTTDENLPIVEVSDSTSASIGSDFVWLANLACTWEHVQAMCDISDHYTSSPAVQFRNKLLHAVLDLQNALGITDLGLLHPVPYKDSHGAIVFVIIRYTAEMRSVAAGNSSLKWTELSKLWKRRATPNKTTGLEAFPVPDQIVIDAQEIIAHHHTSIRPLEKGLYFGYLKARSSVASMKVICSREYPNVLPHLKIRDNPNLSKEEWQWIKSLHSHTNLTSPLPSSAQSLQNCFLSSLLLFLKNLGFSKEEVDSHQLYVHEAIELNEDTTILLVLPTHDQVCTAPGSSDHFADLPDFVALPINTFEIMQLYTYQRSFMTKFSMVSARLEVELLTSHQRLREAFSKTEVTEAKEKKSSLDDFNLRTEQVWKQMRWIEDAVQKGRDQESGLDTLLPLSLVRGSIEHQMKESAKLLEELRRNEEALPIPLQKNKAADGDKISGYLRVIPTYRTGLARGTSVKLYIESTTTTTEVVRLVVNQVAQATGAATGDLEDFYLVANMGKREWILQPDYYPLQLQVNRDEIGKVFLSLRRKSEEKQLNQMVTSV